MSNVHYGTKTTCRTCGVGIERDKWGNRKYCKRCKIKRSNSTRHKYSEMTEFEKLKAKTRRHSRALVKAGLVKKTPCDVCGNPNSEIHHNDYRDAWHFRWLCKKCHTNVHQMFKLIPSLDKTKQM